MRLFIYIITIFSAACSTYQSPNYVKVAHNITSDTAKKLKAKKDLRLIGKGGGMMNKVNMMAMSFVYYNNINIDEGRNLLVYSVNEYLAAINSNEKIRPDLKNYPFTPKNIEIRIFLRNQDHSNVSPGDLTIVSAIEGEFEYLIDDPQTHQLKTIYTETYEEALQKVKRPNNTLTNT